MSKKTFLLYNTLPTFIVKLFFMKSKSKNIKIKVKSPINATGIPFPGGNSEYLLLFTMSQLIEGLMSQKLLVSVKCKKLKYIEITIANIEIHNK